MLTSTKNPRIQRIRKLQKSSRVRKNESVFVVEGTRLIEEALLAEWQPEWILYSNDINNRARKCVETFCELGIETTPASSQVMQVASDTQTPQGILAVFPIPEWEFPINPTYLLILDGVRDPGNLGTLLRTALAAGVETVILPPGGVDVFSPKVVRSAMGAHFRLPVLSLEWETCRQKMGGLNVFLADSAGGQPYYKCQFKEPFVLIIGGEATGASSQAVKIATNRVHIPMVNKTESLNAAIAGAILMFEVLRQRG